MSPSATNSSAYNESSLVGQTEFLFGCMVDRLRILESLHALVESQSLQSQDIDVVLGLLARKQSLLDELAGVQSKLQPFFSDCPDQRVWLSSERREECRRLADQGTRLLRTIMQREQAVIEAMSSRRDAVAAQLREGSDSVLASTAYKAEDALHEGTLDLSDL